MKQQVIYKHEEQLNAWSHAIGMIFGIIGLFLLLRKNTFKTDFSEFSILVYSLSFVVLFTVSAVYHYVESPALKKKLRILDHISIYLLIAGTYTPLTLITLENSSGWTIFYIVWSMAAAGTLLKLFLTGKYEFVSLLLYLGMGWLIVLDYQNIMDHISSVGINLLFLGGAFYTLGIIFYAIEKIPYNHFIWHLFVLAGAVSHWFFIFYGVV